jgi:hypothetical protein
VSDEWLGDLLAALISLRVFAFNFYFVRSSPPPWWSAQGFLLEVRKLTNRAPHLEYFDISSGAIGCKWKRVHGKWVPCKTEEFPWHRELH